MEIQKEEAEKFADQVYGQAVHLMVTENKSGYETKKILIEQGLDEEIASTIVTNLEQQIEDAEQARAKKDMLYGALWFIGGLILTAAPVGYVFWGAIVFGGAQFFRGVINYDS